MAGIAVPACSKCGARRVDEYTHYGCPDGSSDHRHRHWVCVTCEFEFMTSSEIEESDLPPTRSGTAGSNALADS
jgi:hypothetical protein